MPHFLIETGFIEKPCTDMTYPPISKYKNHGFIIGTDLFGHHKNLTVQNLYPKMELSVHCTTNSLPPSTSNLKGK